MSWSIIFMITKHKLIDADTYMHRCRIYQTHGEYDIMS